MSALWWKEAVGYQIYPRTFYDANGDGIGDLQGIISKLDYIQNLGVNLLWIGPFYRSPMDDNGYDVSDFYQVDPIFGTLEDAKALIDEAHQRGIKIILDLVLNHTSDEHPWFIESRSSTDNPKRNYYIWRKGKIDKKGHRQPPNNWGSFFEGSAWNYDAQSDEYYMKIFSNKMPDLNWDHAPLRQDMYAMARWWLDLGVDGFRVDAIAHLARDLSFEDSTLKLNAYGVAPDWSKFSNREALFDYIHEFHHEVLKHYDCMSVGEVGGGASAEAGLRYAGYDAEAFNMVFNFDHCWETNVMDPKVEDDQIKTNVKRLKRKMNYWITAMEGKAWLPQYWLNHDHPRVMSQYGHAQDFHRESGTMLGCVLLSLKGTPFIYNGEEIGMTNVDYTAFEDFGDVWVKNNYQKLLQKDSAERVLRHLRRTSRDNARTPMQWSDEPHGGFSTAQPIQKINQNYRTINVQKQLSEDNSILQTYRFLIHLRRHSIYKDTLIYGSFELYRAEHPDVFAFVRQGSHKLMIIANFRANSLPFRIKEKVKQVIYSNYHRDEYQTQQLAPFEALIVELEP
jgi:oligo-1,6-glucosidase